jgi:hypothetical protein
MPFKDKNRYNRYMREYMRVQRKQVQTLKTNLKTDVHRLNLLESQFPDVHKLLFGRKRRR